MVRLRKLNVTDAKGMLEWMHDPQIQEQFRTPMVKKTLEDAIEFIRNAQTQAMEGGSIHYAIADETDEYLGTISLKKISLIDHNAEYAISLRKSAQGRGVGKEATRQLLQIAFNELELERVYLNVLTENVVAIRLYEKCGFTLEGEFRKHLLLRGEYKSLKWYGILKDDYEKL